jgi:small subunit ribosomal protein S4
MTKRANAKYKIDRRMGENIWGRPRSPFNKREYGPGQHGQRRKGKATDFGTQLKAKQKLKGYYGNISERQFHRYYVEAIRMKGDSSANLIGLLERRLDAVIYRAKFVPTVFAARQFVNHGHISVNGRRVNIASYQVKVGDVVTVKESSRQLAIVLEATGLAERDTPDYLEVDHGHGTAKMTRVPGLSEVPYPTQIRSSSFTRAEFWRRATVRRFPTMWSVGLQADVRPKRRPFERRRRGRRRSGVRRSRRRASARPPSWRSP